MDNDAENRLKEYLYSRGDSVRAEKGTMTGADVLTLLSSLGLTADEAEIRPHIPDWQSVSNETAVQVLTIIREQQNVDIARLLQRVDEGPIKLPVFSYLWYVMPCSTKKPEWAHRKVEMAVDLTPRQILFVTTALVLIVAGIAILVVMSFMWLSQANSRAETQMDAQHALISSFASSFEQQFTVIDTASLSDQADTLALLLEHRATLAVQEMPANLISEATLVSGLLQTAADAYRNATVETYSLVIAALVDMASSGASLADISAGVQTLNADAETGGPTFDSKDIFESTSAGSRWSTVLVRRVSLPGAAVLDVVPVVESSVLECSYGPCDYSRLPCVPRGFGLANSSAVNDVLVLPDTSDIQLQPAIALSAYLAPFDAVVCAVYSLSTLATEQRAAVASVLQRLQTSGTDSSLTAASEAPNLFLATPEYLGQGSVGYDVVPVVLLDTDSSRLFRLSSSNSGQQGTTASSSTISASTLWLAPCPSDRNDVQTGGACDVVALAAKTAFFSGTAVTRTGLNTAGNDAFAAAVRLPSLNVVVVVSVEVQVLRNTNLKHATDFATALNMRGDSDVEFYVAVRETPFRVNSQLNPFRNAGACLGTCERTEPASVAATLAVDTKAPGTVVGPNYQPEAVLSAFTYAKVVEAGIVAERSFRALRGGALAALAGIIDVNNAQLPDSQEVLLITYSGMPPTKTFNSAEDCSHVRLCFSYPNTGVVYRSDCPHCSRLPVDVTSAKRLKYLTKLKLKGQCDRARNCTASNLAVDTGTVAERILEDRPTSSVTFRRVLDYRGASVLVVASYLVNFSAALIVKVDVADIEDPIRARVGIAAAIALVIIVFGLFVLIVFSRHVLDQIEQEWLQYKERIDSEKQRFDEIVKDAVPQVVRDELQKAGKHALSVPALGFAFLDIVGMSERTKAWPPELVCRFMTYVFTLVDTVGDFYRIQKVRMFGDTYFAVAGLGDTAEKEHCAQRCTGFGSVVVQLLAAKYAHYPDAVPHIREAFTDVVTKHGPGFPDVVGNADDVGHVAMPKMRVGLHFGPATVCVIETGRTPLFEIFGPGVGLAARMQATAQGNRVHISGTMKEILERVSRNMFDFDAPRKTVVKGQGTVTSYFVRSAEIPVSDSILNALGIRYSNLKVTYDEATGPGGAAPAPAGADDVAGGGGH